MNSFCLRFLWYLLSITFSFCSTAQNRQEVISDSLSGLNTEIQNNPDNRELLLKRAQLLFKNEDFKAAIRDWNLILENNGEDKEAYYQRGLTKMQMKDYSGAVHDFNKMILLDSTDHRAYYQRGWIRKHYGDRSGACEEWKKAANLGDLEAVKWLNKECK